MPKPDWLKITLPKGKNYNKIKEIITPSNNSVSHDVAERPIERIKTKRI